MQRLRIYCGKTSPPIDKNLNHNNPFKFQNQDIIMSPDYTAAQKSAYAQVRGITLQLLEVEKLEERKFQPQFNWASIIDQTAADLALDRCTP